MQKNNYKNLLLSIYNKAKNDVIYENKIHSNDLERINIIAKACFSQKGVYTVLITLSIYKIIHPTQDIRNHQTQIKNGFSGRSIDTQFITPTLKALNLPSMAESGWLTRSLEQPYPYKLTYVGKISNKTVKKAFLELIDGIENKNLNPQYLLVILFKKIIKIQQKNTIKISPLKHPEKLTISCLINALTIQFSTKYHTFGGSKLPVIAFYAIYNILIKEIARYNDCTLKPLGSHTASDRTSRSAGDIEVYKNDKLFETIEIKLDKPINSNMLRIAKEKIIKFNPQRYYIFSFCGVVEDEQQNIDQVIENIKIKHGCQVVINGVIPTLKYYLRLISNLHDFVLIYSNFIENDSELKLIHRQKWHELILELQNE